VSFAVPQDEAQSAAATADEGSDDSAALSRLAAHFPSLDCADIQAAYERCDGDCVLAERQLQRVAFRKGGGDEEVRACWCTRAL